MDHWSNVCAVESDALQELLVGRLDQRPGNGCQPIGGPDRQGRPPLANGYTLADVVSERATGSAAGGMACVTAFVSRTTARTLPAT